MADPVTVFTSPQPTVNGPLHVGHLAGPYLAADIAARAARARGERGVDHVSGPLDPDLAAIELVRGESALRPDGFDPPLAVRSLLTLLAGGVQETGSLRAALTGSEQE